jgi:hypothetical protein
MPSEHSRLHIPGEPQCKHISYKKNPCPIKQDDERNKQQSGITLLCHTLQGTVVISGNVWDMAHRQGCITFDFATRSPTENYR